MLEALKDLGIIVGVPILRSVGGWLQNSLKDGVIDMIEWRQLGDTVIRMGLIGVATFYSLNGLGIDISALAAGFSAFLLDKLFESMKDKKKK